jgi:hypothetical protein
MRDRYEQGSAAGRRWCGVAAAGAAIVALAACDSLLEVELPGQVRGADLDDPRLAEVMVRSVQGDFECALSRYVEAIGEWSHDFYRVDNGSRGRLNQQRSREVEIYVQDSCETNTFPQIYLPMQTARAQGELTVSLIEGFDQAQLTINRDLLLARAHAYTGYAYEILGETMCELAFNNGPLVTRQQTMQLAVDRFTSAINHAAMVTAPAADVVRADSIRYMALVGRARAHLNMGNGPGVIADASLVPIGFIRYAEMDASLARRYNRVFNDNNQGAPGGSAITVHPSYANLTVGGVPDPRVALVDLGLGTGFDRRSHMRTQTKYNDRGADIPFATGREAQLMIAEVSGGQPAVDIINTLRSTVAALPWVVDSHPGLPAFSSSDPAAIAAEVWEERRRELFLHGSKLGDLLRIDIPTVVTDDFETGVNQRGDPYGPHTCYPLPDQERLGNPNLG